MEYKTDRMKETSLMSVGEIDVVQTELSPERTCCTTRRKFLCGVAGAATMAMASGIWGAPLLLASNGAEAATAEGGPSDARSRALRAYKIRQRAALQQRKRPFPAQPTNGDEELYPERIGSYSKALPHNALGEVDRDAYNALINAVTTGRPKDFERVPLGGDLLLVNPQAAFAYDLQGADSHHLGMTAPPAFSSEEEAGEMAEVYWQALTRDIPFSRYEQHPLIAEAVIDLSRFNNYRHVSAENLFRGLTSGDLEGPYVSQFLWKAVPYGATRLVQRYRVPVAGDDHVTQYGNWLAIQRGKAPRTQNTYDPKVRYIRNGRDLSEFVHWDFSYQAFLGAALILLAFGRGALDEGNPYRDSMKERGFVTFGAPYVLDLVAKSANVAFKAAWYQKWCVHRRLRPEAFGGRIHNHLAGAASYPIHKKILNSQVLEKTFARHGTYLPSMAYPEGSPAHPAYPSGHATVAGACATVLKAFFNEEHPIRNPVIPNDRGTSLTPYHSPASALTVGGELNKLASNIAMARVAAGIHWRTDGTEGLKLGEAVGISILRDFRKTHNEKYAGFSLTTFEGETIVI